ncbi:MAG TPA: C40 family peptidase [Humibacillus xanthopallidus]|nr:C40 family peptidase [Humibacillus xanthopallidus]
MSTSTRSRTTRTSTRSTTRTVSRTVTRAPSRVLAPLLAAGLLAATGSAVAPTAATAAPSVATAVPSLVTATFGLQATRIAAAQKGDPYRWGASGPSAFDCSGLVYYVYKKRLGKNLPRTASAQRLATVRIAKSSIRPGDLVFFTSYGRVYHVGVYAGGNKVWHAPRPGQRVQLSTIWTRAWVAGRVR